jgi:large subunit ribosomal protein L9
MAIEVILMSNVQGLGTEGEVVRVAEGYARNFLLPKKLAAAVTDATRRQLEKKRKEREAQLAVERAEAEALAAKIAQVSCTITVKTGEEGKLFGSVTAGHIAESLKGQGVEIAKAQIELPDAIRELGVFNVPVNLKAGIQTTVKVWVVEE